MPVCGSPLRGLIGGGSSAKATFTLSFFTEGFSYCSILLNYMRCYLNNYLCLSLYLAESWFL